MTHYLSFEHIVTSFMNLRSEKDILLWSAITSNSPYVLVLHLDAGHVYFTSRTYVISLSGDLYINFDSSLEKIVPFRYIPVSALSLICLF